jgi:hypothetical protein
MRIAKWAYLLILLGSAATAALAIWVYGQSRRPLFFDYDYNEFGLNVPTEWRQVHTMRDDFGNYGYHDPYYNMVVVVCAKPLIAGYCDCRPDRAVLLKGTAFEATVTPSYNEFRLICNGKTTRTTIPPGFGGFIHKQYIYIDSRRGENLKDEIERQLEMISRPISKMNSFELSK